MKSFLTLFLISALGVFIIGCESNKGTTENTTKTTVTQTKDGKVTGKTETPRPTRRNRPFDHSGRSRQEDRKDDRDD